MARPIDLTASETQHEQRKQRTQREPQPSPPQPQPQPPHERLKPKKKPKQKPKDRAPRSMDVVKAAGVVLWRRSGVGTDIELALVHRPKYDDWSFPKGKLEPGERHREAALRETFEETGMTVLLGQRLPTQHYLFRDRIKRVRYWSAIRLTGRFVPNREVDELRWLPADKARALLSYEHDRSLVDALLELV